MCPPKMPKPAPPPPIPDPAPPIEETATEIKRDTGRSQSNAGSAAGNVRKKKNVAAKDLRISLAVPSSSSGVGLQV